MEPEVDYRPEVDLEHEDEEEVGCVMDEVIAEANKAAVAAKQVDKDGTHFADKIVANGSRFGQAAVDAALRDVVQNHLNRGGTLQGLVDAANRSFEKNKQGLYMGVTDSNNIVLYTPKGIQTLKLK